MEEYLALKQKESICDDKECNSDYFILHHVIFQPQSTSTPLRIFFDASANTSSDVSLNSILLVFNKNFFLLYTKKHKYTFCADITKMYRPILVYPSDRNLQKILWKTSPFMPIESFRLCTCDNTCASFLAIRTVKAITETE